MSRIGSSGGSSTGGGGSGNVTGLPPTDVQAIARWVDTGGTTIENSPNTFIQDSGAIQAAGFITDRVVTEQITIPTDYTMLAANLVITTGEIVIEADGELLII